MTSARNPFSLHSGRCRERLSVVVTRHAMGEKKNNCVFVVLITEFRLWSGSQNRILPNLEREPRLLPWDIRKNVHHKKDKSTFHTFHCSLV